MIKIALLTGVIFMLYKILDDTTCVFGNHTFIFGINEDVCQKCGISRKRIKIRK